jgi:hypothetical protein
MSTIHTVKLYRPDEGETESMWDLYHAADAVEDRWSRRSTVKDLMRRLNDGELSREERRFIMRAWSVLVDGHLGFGKFMSAFTVLTGTFQDPDVPYVKAKPELGVISTIPSILAKREMNQTELANSLGISRGTLRKYLNDREGTHHVIVDGVFYSRQGYQ